MITAVDTSVLLDVFSADSAYMAPSQEALRRCLREGALIVCDVVVAELRPCFGKRDTLDRALDTLGAEYIPTSKDAALLAGESWQKYRRAGGRRTHLAPDFLVAAHAQTAAERLLTRDRGFYHRWFNRLKLMQP